MDALPTKHTNDPSRKGGEEKRKAESGCNGSGEARTARLSKRKDASREGREAQPAELEAQLLCDVLRKFADCLMVDTAGRGLGVAERLESAGIELLRVRRVRDGSWQEVVS